MKMCKLLKSVLPTVLIVGAVIVLIFTFGAPAKKDLLTLQIAKKEMLRIKLIQAKEMEVVTLSDLLKCPSYNVYSEKLYLLIKDTTMYIHIAIREPTEKDFSNGPIIEIRGYSFTDPSGIYREIIAHYPLSWLCIDINQIPLVYARIGAIVENHVKKSFCTAIDVAFKCPIQTDNISMQPYGMFKGYPTWSCIQGAGNPDPSYWVYGKNMNVIMIGGNQQDILIGEKGRDIFIGNDGEDIISLYTNDGSIKTDPNDIFIQ